MKAPEILSWLMLVVWPVVSGLFNSIVRWKTDEEWVAFCLSRPRLAGLVGIIRAAGLDPVAFVRWLRAVVDPKNAPVPRPSPAPRAEVAAGAFGVPELPAFPLDPGTEPSTPDAKRASGAWGPDEPPDG